MRFVRTGLLALALAPVLACSSATSGGRDIRITSTPQSPETIAKLEAARAANPNSAPATRALGISYYKASRFEDAKATLEAARRLDANDGTTALYFGLTHEALEDIPAAREAYNRYLESGKTRSVKDQLRSRLVFLTRKELELAARQSIANEAQLSAQPGSPTTIAVLPLRFSGPDTSLIPLERGIAELLVTDLARIDRLTIVERDRLQALVEEISRSQGGAFDSTTELRTGRMLRAGRIVQGSILQAADNNLTMSAAIVDVPTSQVVRTARAQDDLEQIFSMEKQLVLQILDGLGMTLTARERGLIEQRPTRSLSAFLAYSRGLQEEDRGNLDRANQFYQQAVTIDPGFQGALQRGASTQAAVQGSQVTSMTVESNLQGTTEGAVVAAAEQGTVASSQAAPSTAGTLSNTTNSLNPSPTSSATTTGTTNSGQGTTTTSGATSTSGGGTAGTGGTAPPSTTNPAGTASGNTSPTSTTTGRITIVIRPPTE